MLEQIIRHLQAHTAVHDWQVELNHKRSHQLFLVGERVESERSVETVRARVRIYNDHPGPEGDLARGEASFVVLPQDDDTAIARKLEEAVFMAGLVSNPPFGLPGPADYPAVEVLDPRLAEEPRAVLDELRGQLIAAASRQPQVRLSSSECFLEVGESELRNSRGVQAAVRSSQALFDFVLISSDGANESEMHTAQQRRRAADFDVPALVARKAAQARDALRATVPPGHRGPVVISREALLDMLAFFRVQSSAQSKFQKLSQLEVGQSVFGLREVRGEPLHLRSDALLPFGLNSGPCDAEGLPGRDVVIIEDNVLRRFWANQRYAEYLGIEPTGAFGNLVIPPGTTPLAELLADGPLIHIVAFSDMVPDMVTGDVVAEIRLGYVVDGDRVTPIKGGALSANLFDGFAQATYAREVAFLGEYLGPEAIRFEQMVIAGE
ncbi:MAG: metallopeptidase TldD-related protein [Anaerolineae bacterium]|nr:metallopeptidase TldD-related protein [Anaerolineae bacterium]